MSSSIDWTGVQSHAAASLQITGEATQGAIV